MAASIREFDFKVPILALSDGTIVDGRLRLKAAQKLKIERAPVILFDEWTPAHVKAFRLMANKSVSWAEWDTELHSSFGNGIMPSRSDKLTRPCSDKLTRLIKPTTEGIFLSK
jgi:hypothetical protein